MNVAIDHLAATVVGAIVLLVLLSLGMRMGEAETDQQVYETSQRMSQSLAQQLEGDLLNIGYGLPPNMAPISAWTDSSVAFHYRDGDAPTDPVVRIDYLRSYRGTQRIDDADRPVYALVRTRDGAPSGGSATLLSSFDLDLLDAAGDATTDPDLATAVRVRYRASFGYGDDHVDNASRYSRTFHPPNLAP